MPSAVVEVSQAHKAKCKDQSHDSNTQAESWYVRYSIKSETA